MKTWTKLALLSLCVTSTGLLAEVKRYPLPDNSTFPIASAVEVNKLVFESGKVPAPKDPKAAKGSVEFWGNTEEQTLSVLSQIESSLKQKGLGMGDVIKMTVFLVGDPALGGKMDFAGFMKGYTKYFGTKEQPALPARSAVQIAGLVAEGMLVEIEVIAARP
jgi:enamine deaminase RidA (YjgF/YER057c/UK114 family)